MIHESHIMVDAPVEGIRECLRCWSCECHWSQFLAAPCKGSYQRPKEEPTENKYYRTINLKPIKRSNINAAS